MSELVAKPNDVIEIEKSFTEVVNYRNLVISGTFQGSRAPEVTALIKFLETIAGQLQTAYTQHEWVKAQASASTQQSAEQAASSSEQVAQ